MYGPANGNVLFLPSTEKKKLKRENLQKFLQVLRNSVQVRPDYWALDLVFICTCSYSKYPRIRILFLRTF